MALTSFELRSRTDKLLQEQQERLAKQRRQKEKELILEQRQREREAAREEAARQKRVQEQLEAEEAEKRREADTEWNRGVYLSVTLQAGLADEAAAAARGIKRSKDKVLLPPSMSASLMDQDAARNGTMSFQLRSRVTGHVTHAGVLEFTAPEGTVLLPTKVRECLFGNGGSAFGLVDVVYKRLEKGTFVQFQPLTRGFHDEVGSDVKHVLEQSLLQYSTLSVGDTVPVEHAGRQYTLQVTQLQPQDAVSVIDTDVEAEVVASVETEKQIAAWEAEQRRNAEQVAAARAALEAQLAAERAAVEGAARAQREAEEAARAAAEQAAQARAQALAAKLAALPPESPAQNSPGPAATVTCGFRLPDGQRLNRRFLVTAPVQQLFDFVDAHGAGGCEHYNLVTQFPRRTIARPASETSETPAQADTGSAHTPMQVDTSSADAHTGLQLDGSSVVDAPPQAVTLQALGLGQSGPELFLLEPL